MLYTHEQGEIEPRILEQCRRLRLPLPDKIKNAPQLFIGLELFYGAYLDLSSCRTGLGDGPISWQSIEEYANVNGFDAEQKDSLHYFTMKMDAAFLKWRSKKNG